MTKQRIKLSILGALVVLSVLFFMFINVDINHIDYAMKIRVPKVISMLLTAFCIGSASMVFQSIINNTIVTPSLLGLNALYMMVHTVVIFIFGGASKVAATREVAFIVDLIIMSFGSIMLYGVFFKKTKGNVLYILLIGTIMSTLFSSVTTTLQRMMDPNEFAALQNAMFANFSRVNSDIIMLSIVSIVGVVFYVRKEIPLLDVISLGKNQAINLGVDYDYCVRKLMIGVTLMITIATALVGPISFLGLIVANLSRQLLKTYRHSYLILGATLIGMVGLVAGQALVEQVFNFGTTISVFINVGGGVYFLYLLLKDRR